MSFELYKANLESCFKENGLESLLDDDACEKLFSISEFLVEKNKVMNLTAITSENDVILKHFLDSASISSLIPANSSVIDIGCGAGFPSIPLAIVRRDLKITALDSTGKRIDFVTEAASRLGLENVDPVCARAEDFAVSQREKFDVCTSRAVARMNVLSELCIPFVKVGGAFIAMKSDKGDEEYAECKSGIGVLGCKLENVISDRFAFLGNEITRQLFQFRKVSSTPKAYPRQYSKILKKPLA